VPRRVDAVEYLSCAAKSTDLPESSPSAAAWIFLGVNVPRRVDAVEYLSSAAKSTDRPESSPRAPAPSVDSGECAAPIAASAMPTQNGGAGAGLGAVGIARLGDVGNKAPSYSRRGGLVDDDEDAMDIDAELRAEQDIDNEPRAGCAKDEAC